MPYAVFSLLPFLYCDCCRQVSPISNIAVFQCDSFIRRYKMYVVGCNAYGCVSDGIKPRDATHLRHVPGERSLVRSYIPAAGKFAGGHRWPPLIIGGHWQMLMDNVCQRKLGAANHQRLPPDRIVSPSPSLEPTGGYWPTVQTAAYVSGPYGPA
jgi:hypothetical protein